MARTILIRILGFGLISAVLAACGGENLQTTMGPGSEQTATTAPKTVLIVSQSGQEIVIARAGETPITAADANKTPANKTPANKNAINLNTGIETTDNNTSGNKTPDIEQSLREMEESEKLISELIVTLSRDNATALVTGSITINNPDTNQEETDGVTWDIGSSTSLQQDAPAVTDPQAVEPSPDVIPPDAIPQAVIPQGQDPSLASEALATAFALAREQRAETEARLDDPSQPDRISAKSAQGFRIAMLLPNDGPGKTVSRYIREGAELALFKLGGQNIDMIFLDSDNPARAAADALRHDADLILGPVFAERARAVGAAMGTAGIPVLTFSNDITAAGGNVLLLGQTPEQEIETVLAQALTRQKPNAASGRNQLAVAIISQDKAYGQRISNHAAAMLDDAGLPPVANIVLSPETLASEKALRQAIRNLTGWVPSSNQGQVRPPNFDLVIIAGDLAFSLRVAPVLAWYDLDPEKTRYLGTSQWSSPAILQEPSLRGGWFADAPEKRQKLFDSLWQETGKPAANRYTIMGFDAVALASTLVGTDRNTRLAALTQNAGFAGFSGMFRLLPDGRNIRLLDVREITTEGSQVITPARSSFQ